MKVLLTSLNAKYIHTNLAIRYLEAFCRKINNVDIKIKEFTINDRWEKILPEIYKERADVIGLSCYIWNIKETIKIVQLIKTLQPQVKIILGGPEVTFYGKEWMNKIREIDYIVKGEGEITFFELLKFLENNKGQLSNIKGLLYRDKKNYIIENQDREPMKDLDEIPFPYPKDLSEFKNKIIYFESSRGCPFHCQYCLSSITERVRYFSIDNVKKYLRFFIDAEIKQVKFVDRTFNCNLKRTKELLEFLIEQKGKTNFHFEIAADLIDEEILKIFKKAPVGLFQLEIGVQSTYMPTLESIHRKNDFQKIKKVVKTIKSFENIHQHLDLIAGLPYEDYNTFKKSFNDVYSLNADMLQLGFLKVLKGSGIEAKKEKYGYHYTVFPPYEVLFNDFISYEEIIKLKMVEDLLEKYKNSHVFEYTLNYVLEYYYNQPFDFFEDFSRYWKNNRLFQVSHSQKNLYKIFLDFWSTKNQEMEKIHEILKFDYLVSHKPPLPKFFYVNNIEQKKEKIFHFLNQPQNIEKYLPEFVGVPVKEIKKYVHFEAFSIDILNILSIEKRNENRNNVTLLFYFPRNKQKIFNKAVFSKIKLE
ncbi:B12-binding domain-containing radical SAM protein [Garciella nitratireducens]|uniref:Radical SAM superfamily enzyme YgiQ, UPF0313 family n=1 Tax=Garciella nitratireducens DSM 15102 TaxID=1121911 RepID=A0A1T4KR75_9FIRM|nr:B12-binding domain-containing radical SAM protein [Garciella nitratireducens]SJZ44880.1 Radical SAM superfamily enzyme YgiQ, UPF0313 family [Garciella nitratireducens DSM 15102]